MPIGETDSRDPPKVGGPRGSILNRLREPHIAVPAALVLFSLLFYAVLNKGLQKPASEASLQEESLPLSNGPSGSSLQTLGGEMAFSKGRDELAAQAARNAERLAARYGKSSAEMLRGSAAAPPRFYDDVAKGVGQTIRGILRPPEARRRAKVLTLESSELEAALGRGVPPNALSSQMPSAGKARSVAAGEDAPRTLKYSEGFRAAEGSAEQTAAQAYASPASASGLRIAVEEPLDGNPQEREMREVSRGGVEGGVAAARAVNNGSGQTQDVLAQSPPPSVGPGVEGGGALPTGSTTGRIREFRQTEGVKSTVDEATNPKEKNEPEIAKLTSAQVHGKAGSADGVKGTERSLDLGGVVFDGRIPTGGTVSGPGDAVVATNPKANKLLTAEGNALEEAVVKCQTLEKSAASDARKELRELEKKGLELRSKVADCRDKYYTGCNPIYVEYTKCRNAKPKPCSRSKYEKMAKNAIRSAYSTCRGQLAELGNSAKTYCSNYQAAANDRMRACPIEGAGAVVFKDCDEQFIKTPLEMATFKNTTIVGPSGTYTGGGANFCVKEIEKLKNQN